MQKPGERTERNIQQNIRRHSRGTFKLTGFGVNAQGKRTLTQEVVQALECQS